MKRADPLRIGLEVGPDQQNAQMVRAQGCDGIQVSLDGVRVPRVPAKPPVLRGRVVHAKAVAVQFMTPGRSRTPTGDSRYASVSLSCKQRRAASHGARNPNLHRTPQKVSPIHFASPQGKQKPAAHDTTQVARPSPRIWFLSSITARLYTPGGAMSPPLST